MNLPFEAFASQDASAVPYGRIYYAGGHWHMSVDANNGNVGTASGVILTGTNIGNFIPNPFGQALYVADPYRVMMTVDPTHSPDPQKNAAALMVTGQARSLCCYRTGVPFEVTKDGALKKLSDFPTHRFQKWSAWLAKGDEMIGDTPLFTVTSMQ
ncbi:hypothetical protein [Stenotrophomonas maltophilia]|uniref:hypothetical protein n=1 Tax=Stenotrophomonas maltophilia TaxID=40324 RepID=UPI001FA794C6|nr:hypothetical protein [Stenotrophomonas maltophilia]